jgi:hypothetical protein
MKNMEPMDDVNFSNSDEERPGKMAQIESPGFNIVSQISCRAFILLKNVAARYGLKR